MLIAVRPRAAASAPRLRFESGIAHLHAAGDVCELYQRLLTHPWNLCAVQTTTPSGFGTSENGW